MNTLKKGVGMCILIVLRANNITKFLYHVARGSSKRESRLWLPPLWGKTMSCDYEYRLYP